MERDLRGRLRGALPEEKLGIVPRSFEVIGSREKAVAVVEMPEELRGFEAAVAEALMEVHENLRSVLVKESERSGPFRTRRLRLVAGDPDTEVIHREAGCLFKLDPRRVYFSAREVTERDRITARVGEAERVLTMFSGVGPFPIRIARARPSVLAMGVELNPEAHRYAVENIRLNRVDDRVTALLGDVREVCSGLSPAFDRIIMPLPKGAEVYLDVAMPLLADGGVLHFYHWAREPDLFSRAVKAVEKTAEAHGRRTLIEDRARVSQYSPRVWKVRVDARLFKS